MTFCIKEKTMGKYYIRVEQDKNGRITMCVCYYGKTIYENTYTSIQNATRAFNRMVNKYERRF